GRRARLGDGVARRARGRSRMDARAAPVLPRHGEPLQHARAARPARARVVRARLRGPDRPQGARPRVLRGVRRATVRDHLAAHQPSCDRVRPDGAHRRPRWPCDAPRPHAADARRLVLVVMRVSESFPRQNARTRRFTLGAPRDLRVADDGSRVVFLRSTKGDDPVNRMWAFDVATRSERVVWAPDGDVADDDLPAAERARRERARELAGGIVSYDI